MKPDVRWQILLSAVGLALILGLMSYQVQSAALCTVTVPASGGSLQEGTIGRPLLINPLFSDEYPADRELVDLVFDGLLEIDDSGRLTPALAESWAAGEDGLTFRVRLRDDLVWHDGQQVTADDVVFSYGVLANEELPIAPALRALWQTVTIVKVDELTVDFTLAQPYSPFPEALTRGIVPAHLLVDLPAADLATVAFNRHPVGTGPFMVEPGQDWERSGRIDLIPNPIYWREGTQLASLSYRFFPDESAMLAAYGAGELQAMNGVPATALAQPATQDGTRLFTSLAARYSTLIFNQGQGDAAAMRQREVRQALAFALDREVLVDRVLQGQGVVFDGPYLPSNVAYNPGLLTAYTYQPETAAAMLDGVGWTLPQGGQTRQRADQPLMLRFVAIDTPTMRAITEAIAVDWQAVGVSVQPTYFADAAALRQALDEGSYDVALVDVLPPADPDLYDFWSQEAIVRGQNYASWNNRRASEALEFGRRTLDPAERTVYYDSFLRQFDADLPALTLYQHTEIYALSDVVQEAEVGRFDRPRERYGTFDTWFLLFRDVTVICPPEA